MQQYHLTSEPRNAPSAPSVEADAVLAGLNEAQQEAVRAADGPVLIVAGPGSGKTRTLTHRIAYLLAMGKARPSQILAITFTNKAAREMRSRTDRLVGGDVSRFMTIGTFHATFARLLRREASALGFTADFSIYDTDDTQRALRELMDRFHIDPKQHSPRSMYGMISSAKNRMIGPSEYASLATGLAQEKAATLYAPYQELLRRSNAMDFDDLLLKPIELFRNHPDVLERYRDRWQFVHVDEYQDTNHAQYTVTRLLADGHRNLCVVGDDAQSIYAFRGADIGNILSFQRDYPEATVVRLEQNYRSSKTIVRLADRIIKGNSRQLEKKLWTDNEEGEPVLVLEALSERDEAQKVERRIRDLCLRRGLRYREVAVLYRTNAQSRSLEEAFRREDVPYRIVGGVSFYQRREIKDAIAYLRLVVNPDDGAHPRDRKPLAGSALRVRGAGRHRTLGGIASPRRDRGSRRTRGEIHLGISRTAFRPRGERGDRPCGRPRTQPDPRVGAGPGPDARAHPGEPGSSGKRRRARFGHPGVHRESGHARDAERLPPGGLAAHGCRPGRG